MHRVHLDHWWISRSELLALESIRSALAVRGLELTSSEDEAEVSAHLMSAQRIWEGVCGTGLRPIDLSPCLTPFDLEARIFAPFRAVIGPSHLSLHGVPLGAQRNNSLWVNRRMAEQVGMHPGDLDDWFSWLKRAEKIVSHPLAIGRENWHHSLLFEVVVLAMHGADFHRSAFGMESPDALASPQMREALEFIARLRRFVSPRSLGMPWHALASECEAGRCAAIVMGDWVHNEFSKLPCQALQPYRHVYKWAVPGTATWFLYNVDYVVAVERMHRPTHREALSILTRALLEPQVQCAFGRVKGALPAVRDAVEATIDPASWKMFHLATLCPEILIPSMSLLQGSSRGMRDRIAQVVRGMLTHELSLTQAQALISGWGQGSRGKPRGVACSMDDHHCASTDAHHHH